ncbi:MAG: hypothetical protein JW867_06595, partial [Candidatus Omnitrophica bacterium]|nr:hypothetical protein [Candidatus Omnitrophota bacterium]
QGPQSKDNTQQPNTQNQKFTPQDRDFSDWQGHQSNNDGKLPQFEKKDFSGWNSKPKSSSKKYKNQEEDFTDWGHPIAQEDKRIIAQESDNYQRNGRMQSPANRYSSNSNSKAKQERSLNPVENREFDDWQSDTVQ